jgi:hypothetical protein
VAALALLALALALLACGAAAQQELQLEADGAWTHSDLCVSSGAECTRLHLDVPAGSCVSLTVVDLGCSGDKLELVGADGSSIATGSDPGCSEGGADACCGSMDCGTEADSCYSDSLHSLVETVLPQGKHVIGVRWTDLAGVLQGQVAAAVGGWRLRLLLLLPACLLLLLLPGS